VYVYIVREGKAQKKRVKVNFQDMKDAEITAGIQASDLVITNPEKLKDGAPVKIKRQ
jgi:hypothetical protein